MNDLRRRAEDQMELRPPAVTNSQAQMKGMVHELQVHQVELEMQNETLRQVQIDLELARDSYLELYESAPVGYITLTDAGLISQINLTGATLLGTERGQLLTRRFDSFVTSTDRARCRRELASALKHDGQRVLDLTLQCHDGRRREVLLVSRRVTGDGEAPMLRVTLSDVTELKLAQRELQGSELLTSSILDSVSASIAVLDHDGFIIAVNESWRRFALENSPVPGVPDSRTDVGINYLEICGAASGDSSEGAHEAHDGIRAVLDGRLPRFSQVYSCHSPTEKRWFGLSAVRLNGEIHGVIVIHSDVTELQEKEHALEKLRAELQELLHWEVARHTVAAIAHEVNQPLSSISSLCEAAIRLLTATPATTPGQFERILRMMAAESEAAGGKIRHLLESLRTPTMAKESVALAEVLHAAVQLVRQSGSAQRSVLIQCPDDLPSVLVHRTHVEKVLVNLLNNSFEAMSEMPMLAGRVWIVAGLDGAGGEVRVTVRDEGPGIGREMEHQLFHPFATSKRSGLGLGLTISRALIEAQGGKLWGEPRGDAGATFHFTLPVAQTP